MIVYLILKTVFNKSTYVYITSKNLALHLFFFFQNMGKVFECPTCHLKFDKYKSLATHKHEHHSMMSAPQSNIMLKCPSCLYATASPQEFFNHAVSVHSDSSANSAVSEPSTTEVKKTMSAKGKQLHCDICNQTFSRPYTYKLHVQRKHAGIVLKHPCYYCAGQDSSVEF